MRALIQRVSRAEVTVDGEVIGKIGAGLLVFVCAMQGDGPKTADALAARISKLRIFPDDEGRMNRSLVDVGGSVLAISQFTLAGDTTRGNRPGFSAAAEPGVAEALYERFVEAIAELRISVKTGRFGAHMEVSLVNDGPVTIWMDTALRDPRS